MSAYALSATKESSLVNQAQLFVRVMRRVGKQGQKTAQYVEKWKRTQKPNHQGYFVCYISGQWIPYLMAEHPYSKTRHPDLRTNQTLEPVSAEINKLKGSLDIQDFLEKYPEYKKTVKPEYLI